jgi:hypothetical protein
MKSTSSGKVLFGVSALALLSACSENPGPTRTETRELSAFESIDMEGAARLEISVGGENSVQVEGPEEVLKRLTTEVRDNTLYIESRPKDWLPSQGRARVTLRIAVPKLASLSLGGGNNVLLSGYAGGESTIAVEGAAHIKAKGELDRLTVRMAGAGHADFSELVSKDTHVTVDGVGNVIVHPKDKLDATMNGVGAIYYAGSPTEVSTRMNGLGTIRKQRSGSEEASEQRPKVDPDSLQPEYEEKEDAWKKAGETEVI